MFSATQLNLRAFPNSRYAAELHKPASDKQFGPELEAEYLRAHLMDSRVLIRAACMFTLLVVILRALEQAGSGHRPFMVAIVFIGLTSAVLAVIAWSSAFERLFTPCAHVVVPIRNAVLAIYVAAAVALGRLEMLMVLAPAVIGPFFFLGLRRRAALFCGVVTLVCFVGSAIFHDLASPLVLRTSGFLLLTLMACGCAARHWERRSRTAFLETRLIAEIAEHDTLTGAKNRRVFDEHLAQQWPKAIEESKPLAVLLIDVDHFKAYNDRYGHQAGDEALRRVAQTLSPFVSGPQDVLARYGGEEFAAVLHSVDGPRALDIAEQMRAAICDLDIEHRGSRTSSAVTISVGVALVEPSTARTPRGALQLADQALYQAKVNGRNRVELKNAVDHQMLVTGVFSLSKARTA